MRSIGIDIGSLSIKIADVELSGRSLILRDYFEIPFSADPSMDKKIQLIEGLRKISEHYDPSQVKLVLSVPQDRVSIRHKIFPFKERIKILKSLPFELDEEIPFDQEKAIFDAKIIKYRGQATELLACACPDKYIDDLIQFSNEAGVDPDIISTDGFALSNLFTKWHASPPEADALTQSSMLVKVEGKDGESNVVASADMYLHIGHSKTVVVVLQNQFLIETRSINLGGNEIVKAIQRTYEISYVEALKGVQEKGFILTRNDGASKDQITFSNTIQKALTPLVLEIQKTQLEVESEMNVSIQNIHLMGGVSGLINISPYFTQQLGIVSNFYNHLSSGIKVYANQTNELMKNSSVAIGLAIEGIKKLKNPPINFRKGLFAKQGSSFEAFYKKWKKTLQYATAIFVLFSIYSYTRSVLTESLREKTEDTISEIARSPTIGLKGAQARPSQIEKYIREKKKEIKNFQQLSGMRDINSPIDILNQITRALPPKTSIALDIRQLTINNEIVSLEGDVANPNQVQLIKNSLSKIAMDKSLQDAKPGVFSNTGKTTFRVNFKMSRK